MGGKAKWRKLKRVVGPTTQGTQPPAKQHSKKDRSKTRDVKRRRMGDADEEDDDEADATVDGSKKEPQLKDSLKRSSKKGKESIKNKTQDLLKSTAKTVDKDVGKEPETRELPHIEVTTVIEEANATEVISMREPPIVLVTDLDKDLDSPLIEGLHNPSSETLKEELKEATQEESTPTEHADEHTKIIATETASQKATQTDAITINNGNKPVKFFISDDSDSDTAIFVDANQGASNGTNGMLQETAKTSHPQREEEGDIEISAVIDIGGDSTVEVTVGGQDIEFGIEEATESQIEVENETKETDSVVNGESPVITQLIDVEPSESPKSNIAQRARFLQSLAHSVKPETQKKQTSLRRHGPTKFPFDNLTEGDNISRSSASDSVDTVSITKSSVSDLADPDNISKTSTSESADHEEPRISSMSDSVDLDTTSATSTNESVENETASKVSVTESAEQETMTISTAESIDADVPSKMSTVESVDPGTLSKSSTRGSIDQDIVSKSSTSELGEADAVSRSSISESIEQEAQSKTSYSEYEEAEGVARTSASESGEPDSTSRTSVSESGEFDGTSRTSVSDSVDDNSKASMSVTGTSASATGEYMTSKSSVSYSSEFDAESLSSTADLLTPKEETSYVGDIKAEPGVGESPTLEKESPVGTPDDKETAEERTSSPAWEQLNLEDHVQLTKEGSVSEAPPPKDEKDKSEADAESLFFSLYPEYQPGEVDESDDTALKITTGNPKVLCFRGQTPEQGETQEEIYMATEKRETSSIKEGRNKGSVSGKIHQLQRKLSQQKKSERENKEVLEPERPAAQQTGSSGGEQQDAAEQRPQEISKQGGPESSPDFLRGRALPHVLESATASAAGVTKDADTEKTEHTISKKKDDLVCLSGQLGERIETLTDYVEVTAETITNLLKTEEKTCESELTSTGTEAGQNALEVENKLEGNAKDRKTLVGKARDWIKGVTRMGAKKEEINDKGNDKAEVKKAETNAKIETEINRSANGEEATLTDEVLSKEENSNGPDNIKDTKDEATVEYDGKEKEVQLEEQSEESDSTVSKDNGMSINDQAIQTEEVENLKNANKDAQSEATENNHGRGEEEPSAQLQTDDDNKEEIKEEAECNANDKDMAEKDDVKKEKVETESIKDAPFENILDGQEDGLPDGKEVEGKEEDLFNIVGPEEELSDAVFKDDTCDGNGKPKDVDDTKVQEIKAEESVGTEEEKTTPRDKDVTEITEPIEETVSLSQEESLLVKEVKYEECKEEAEAEEQIDVSTEALNQAEGEKQDNEETISKESESSFVSVQEDIEPAVSLTKDPIIEAVPEEIKEKRRKGTKDELKPRRKRHEKSKSPSAHKESLNEDGSKASSKRDKEAKSGTKKQRHSKRTKSQEESEDVQIAILQADDEVQKPDEPKPEDVALPPDDFENETEPTQDMIAEGDKDLSTKEQESLIKQRDSKIINEGAQVEEEEIVPKEATVLREKKKTSSKSSKEKRHIKKSDDQLDLDSGDTTEHKRHSRSRREKSTDPKREKHDVEKLEKDIQKTAAKLESPREKLQSECDAQTSFTATAASWSPRVGRRDRKSSKKSSERKRDGQSADKPKILKEKKDETDGSLPTKPSSQVLDDDLLKTSPKLSKKVKPRKPNLSINIIEPRDDTPIPSPRSLTKSEESSTGTQPLLQTLTFPPGVSKPISPLPPTKELKFPLGVSKPISPLPPTKELKFPLGVSKPISPLPSAKELKFPLGVSKPLSPLPPTKELKFPPGVSVPISPLPPTKELKFPPEVSVPISPLPPTKELKFPLGVSVPISPLPPTKELKFPPGVAMPISPLPSTKETKFTPEESKANFHLAPTREVSKTLAPLPKKTQAPKPIPAPLNLKPDVEPSKSISTLSTLTFPEGVSKPISPLPKKVQQLIPKPDSSSLQVEKPLPCPAKPVSPLKTLNFPEGITKPISPLTKQSQESEFTTLSKIPKVSSSVSEDKEVKAESSKHVTSTKQDFEEASKPESPIIKKTRPRITIQKLEPTPSETVAMYSDPTVLVSPLNTLKFPEGVSKPISPIIQKGQQSVFELAEKMEKLAADSLNTAPDSTETDLPMKEPAIPVSPLRKMTFPEGINKPVSPIPPKDTQSLFEPTPASKPIPYPLKLSKSSDGVCEADISQVGNKLLTELSSSLSQTSKASPETLTVLTFPEGVSKPVSPLPQKTKFSTELFKTTQESTKPTSPTTELSKTTYAVEKTSPPPSELMKAARDTIKPPIIPSDFFKTVHPGEKPPFLSRVKTTSPAKEMLKVLERSNKKPASPDPTSPLKTFKFPEGVSIPVSPLPLKGKSQYGTTTPQTLMQKEQTISPVPISPTQERYTVFTFSHPPKQSPKEEESDPKLTKPSSEVISPSPVKIKHTVDFPSDSFPCAKASPPLIKTVPSTTTKVPSPAPKISSPVTQLPPSVTKLASPIQKITSPLSKPGPLSQNKIVDTSTKKASSSASPSLKSEPKIPKSILSTRLKSSQEVTKPSSPDQSSESIKSSLKSSDHSSPGWSPKIHVETTKSTISQTHLTYSEASKRFTPSPRMPDEIYKEITATPPMTPPPEPEQLRPTSTTSKGKPSEASSAIIQTADVRSAAKYSRGEGTSHVVEERSPAVKDRSRPVAENERHSERQEKGSVRSSSGIRRLHDSSQEGLRPSPEISGEGLRPSPEVSRSRHEDCHSAKDGSQSPQTGYDSASKKLRRRKRR